MSSNRRQFFSSLAALPVLGAAVPQKPRPLNVLFIVSDDMNTELACYGSPTVHSPNLDRLARRSVLFERNYCQFPLCAPSRTSFLSGRRPETTRVWNLITPTRQYMPDVIMLPQLFRKHGYYSAHVGKVFHTGRGHTDPRSWDFAIDEFGKNPPKSEILKRGIAPKPRNHTMEWDILKTHDQDMPDGFVARKVAQLMRRCTQEGKPFFLAAGFRRPHAPYAAPQKYFDLYNPAHISMPLVGDKSKILPAAWFELANEPPLTGRQTLEYRAAYYACISFVDAQVAQLLDTVDELKLWDNTVIVYLTDHGYHTGQHGMWHKMTLYEEAARVPLIIYAPGMSSGKRCLAMTESVDVYPTLAELCGLSAPGGLEGSTLVPLLRDPSQPGKKAAYTMVGRNNNRAVMAYDVAWLGKSVRTSNWRYTEWDQGKRGIELYDETRDPHEMNNLAETPKYRPAVLKMKELLHAIK